MNRWIRALGVRLALLIASMTAPVAAVAADYAVNVTRIQQDYYRVGGQRVVVATNACFEFAFSAPATLSVSVVTGTGELRFGTGTRCTVVNTYSGQTLAQGSYSVTVTGEGELFETNGRQWLVETLFTCGFAVYGQAATLRLSSNAVDGNAFGDLTISGRSACSLYWVYRAWSAVSSTPGPELMPDLVIDAVSVPLTATAGQPITINITTRNRGNAPAGSSKTRLYLSLDAVKSADDAEVAYCTANNGHAAGASTTCAGSITLPLTLAAGSYYAIAVADADQEVLESDGSNNTRIAPNLVQISAATGFPLTMLKSGLGQGSVKSADDLAQCAATSPSCTATLAKDAQVVLIATPSMGSLFTGWSGACSGLGECRVTMSSARSVTATFAQAASVQQVPWVTQADGYLSRFALVNTSNRTLTYNFVLHGASGQTVQLDAARAQATLPPKTQRVVELSQLVKDFGGSPRALVVLSSDGQDAELSAMYNLVQPSTGSISNLAFQRATDRTSPSSQLSLPWLTLESSYNTELVLANSGDRAVTANLSALPQSAGSVTLRRNSLTVPARAQLVVPAEELVQISSGSTAGLSMSTDAPSGLLRGSYVMTHRTTGATNATELVNPSSAAGASTTLVVPWFSVVDGYDSRFVLINRSNTPATFNIEVRGETGNTLGLGVTSGSIPAQGQVEIPAKNVLVSTTGGLTRASAVFTVQAAPGFIEGSYQIRSQSTGALNQTAMAKPATSGAAVAKLVLPWFSRVDGYISRFVLVNRSAVDAPFTVEVLPEAGNAVSAQTVAGGVVPARGMLVVPASQFVTAFEKLPRAAAVLRVQAPDDQIEALYNIVNPATGSISNTLLVHAAAESAAPPTVPMQAQRMPYTDPANNRAVGFVDAVDPNGRPLVFSLVNAPARGTLALDPVSGRFVYTPAPGQGQPTDRFTVSVFNGVASRQLSIDVMPGLGDPLYGYQWHLRNLGQSAFASTLPVAGFDLNVEGAWALGYSGQGIKIGIVDDGLEMRHPDLIDRTDFANSRHFGTGGNDPSPASFEDNHGTQVGGIAAASGFNGLGGRGVAYQARLRGYNYLNHQALANFANSIGSAAYSADNDLFNLSLGVTTNALPSFTGDFQAATSTAIGLRGGRGAPLLVAAGNRFLSDGSSDADCAKANQHGVSCLDPATSERNGGYYPIIVGALRSDGRRSSYSNSGSSLWISAPGGEYGSHLSFEPGLSQAKYYEPAIVTTSMRGCNKPGTPNNALDTVQGNAFAPSCEYTATMNGTSAAAPNVAGVVALMLQANPRLTTRDVKHILASTARRVHPEHVGKRLNGVLSDGPLDLELGWQQNAAGFWFNTWYGFGAVDAQRAVAAARDMRSLLPPLASVRDYIYRAPANALVHRGTVRGYEVGVQVEETAQTVESVVLFFSLSQTPSLSCNQIELVSPAGTRAIVLHAYKGFTNASVDNSRLVSHAFYGEALNGRWTLRFLDVCTTGNSTVLDAGIDQKLLFIAR